HPVAFAVRGILIWTDTIELEAADDVRIVLEQIKDADAIITEFMDITTANAQHTDDIGFLRKRLVVVTLERGLDVLGIAAKTCELLRELAIKTVMRILHVVDGVVGQRVADRRTQPRTMLSSL